MDLDYIKQQYQKLSTMRDVLQDQLEQERERRRTLKRRVDDATSARAILQNVAQKTQQNVEERISNLVTMALATVFPEDHYQFRAEFVQRNNKSECDLYFLRNGERIDPMTGSGGGVLDIASFALRVSLWSIKKTSPVMILDEFSKFVSAEYRSNVGEMAKAMCDKLGLQIILVTHQDELSECANVVYDINDLMKGKKQ